MKIWLFACMYVVITLVTLFLLTPSALLSQRLLPFYKDPTTPDRVHMAIINNPTGTHALLTRFFHNKVGFMTNAFFIALARSSDPVFFFSLFPKPYYGDSYYTFTSPIYFPFFLVGAVTLIRKWPKVKKQYKILPYLFGGSLLLTGLFIPYTAPLKLIPLFISVQLIIFFGCYELIKLCLKN